MNLKRILGCTVLGIVASAGGTTQAKVLSLRAAAKTSVSNTCLYALNTELHRAGITTQDATDGADSEMVASFEFTPGDPWPTGEQEKTTYSIVVKSIPGDHLLYADQGYQEGPRVDKSCSKIANKIVKKFLAAGGLK